MDTFKQWLAQVASNPNELLFVFLIFLSIFCFVLTGLLMGNPKRFASSFSGVPLRHAIYNEIANIKVKPPKNPVPLMVIVNVLFTFGLGLGCLIGALMMKGVLIVVSLPQN